MFPSLPLALGLLLTAQAPITANAAKPAAFDLEMSGERVVHAQARQASLVSIARRLSTLLKVPVHVSPDLAKSRVTFEPLKNAPLSALLMRLTASPLVDTREQWGAEPKLVAIHIGADLATPDPTQGDQIASGMLVEGHTDDDPGEEGTDAPANPEKRAAPQPTATPAEPEGPFLRVRKEDNGRISVRAREQGVASVLFEVALAFRVRFDMRVSEGPVVPELSAIAALPSELPAILGPGVGLLLRRNLATGEERPLRFFLDSSDSSN